MGRRIKIEVADGIREKVTITLEGEMSRERIFHIMDILQLLETQTRTEGAQPEERSKFEKVQDLIQRKFPTGWFTSQDVMVAYEDLYEEPIVLSTVSTYLARLAGKGEISRSGSMATRRYRRRGTEAPRNSRNFPA